MAWSRPRLSGLGQGRLPNQLVGRRSADELCVTLVHHMWTHSFDGNGHVTFVTFIGKTRAT
jgi:hypothetical protein